MGNKQRIWLLEVSWHGQLNLHITTGTKLVPWGFSVLNFVLIPEIVCPLKSGSRTTGKDPWKPLWWRKGNYH